MDLHDEPIRPGLQQVALRVARWGNSLAVRLPVHYVRRARLVDGDTLLLTEVPDGTLSLAPQRPFDRGVCAERLREQCAKMKVGSSVIDRMREDARY